MASNGMTLNIKPEQVMATSMRRTKGGFNSAAMAIKLGDSEYLSISYEWEGDAVTDTAMDFMGFMQANKEVITAAIEDHKEETAAAKKKGKMPWMKDEDEDEDEDEDDEKNPKKDKKSKKKVK